MAVNYAAMTRDICERAMYNVRDELQVLPVEEIRQHQPTLGFAVCCVNVLGDLNIGTMMRSAVLYGADEFFVAGRRRYNRCSTVGAQNYVNITYIDCMRDEMNVDWSKILDAIRTKGYVPVVCETNGKDVRHYAFPEKPCFIFGNEGLGLPKAMIDAVDEHISIRQFGVMRSHNVAVAASIIMHEFTRNIQ